MTEKIDFHIHTLAKAGGKDEAFDFSLDWLTKYIDKTKLTAISVTNHNLFNENNFMEIKKEIDINLFPGMEIDLDGGHVNLIYPDEPEYIEELIHATNVLESLKVDESISTNKFQDIFKHYKDGILVFEMGKSNSLQISDELSSAVCVGGVASPLRFQKFWNNQNEIVPVLFSDCHASTNGKNKDRSDIIKLSKKLTYIQSDDATFTNIKSALTNKENVNIYENGVHDTFPVDIDDNGGQVFASKGLNLVVGRRGSGKTHFIEEVLKENSNDVYSIPQFESTKQEKFLKHVKRDRESQAVKNWSEANQHQITAIKEYVENYIEDDGIKDYLKKLNKYAVDYVRSHSKLKNGLFSESQFEISDLQWIDTQLATLLDLIRSKRLWEYIPSGVKYKNNLIDLYNELKNKYLQDSTENVIKEKVNDILAGVQEYISARTGQTKLPSIDINTIMKQKLVAEGINSWMSEFDEKVIDHQVLEGYKIDTKLKPYQRVSEFQDIVHTREALNDCMKLYKEHRFDEYFISLKKLEFYKQKDMVDYLAFRETDLLTSSGIKASGGQAVALALTLRLKEATSNEVILVDEPEASLDNEFIKSTLVPILQKLAKEKTVFVITHNSTLGSLLHPDYLIVTKQNQNGKFSVLSGEYDSRKLKDSNNNEYSSYDDFVDAMEAGITTYKQKGENYENLKNN